MSIENIGTSPAGANADTEGTHGNLGAAPTGTTPASGSVQETGTSAPGGSLLDVIPGASGSETGPIDSGYGVVQPDTASVYGGTAPPFTPVDTSLGAVGVIDTTIGGGAVRVDASPAYRAPSAYVAGGVRDTSLTDILGNQINAPLPVSSAAYVAANIDTSQSGGPSNPSPLLTQVDTFLAPAAAVPIYLSQLGVMPATIVVRNTTTSLNLVLTTDYTVTTSGNGAQAAAFITLITGSGFTAGNNITITYSYGDPQYFDSNLPPAQTLSATDTLALRSTPVQLLQQGITTAAASLTVVDVTRGNTTLTVNVDYTVQTVFLASTAGSQAAALKTYTITRVINSPNCSNGDVILVTYNYTTSVPAAPGMGAQLLQTDTITLNSGTPAALSKTGIVTSAANLVVFDVTTAKLLVLGTDYTVTPSGSGATLTYTVTRVVSSVNSANGNTATVAYAYGNAFYFNSSGPVIAGLRGVMVPWTPPAGTTPVDYYLIQSNTGATMYVPKTGQPMNDGQPAPSGGATAGEPTYQADTITLSGSPSALSKTGIVTPDGQLTVRDTVTGVVLYETLDYIVTTIGVGPYKTYTITRVASSQNSANGDSAIVEYWWYNPSIVQAFFTQGLVLNTAKIYNPDGTVRSFQGYQFQVAAGNRAGLGPFSAWSDYAIPLNPNVVPGFLPQQGVHPSASLDPANTINPVYLPNGTVKAGTGLGG